MVTKKQHPLKGRKQSPETIAKRLATLAAKRTARENGERSFDLLPPKRKYNKRQHADTRTHEQLMRDVKEATWCLEKAVAGKRAAIATGAASLTDVTDEETFMYMAIRYLQGGLR
jgi:hypothetical protein